VLINARTGGTVASTVEIADTRASRRKGLLGRDGLEQSAAILLSPCFAIHTAGMRFPIDALFLNRGGVVVHIARDLGPWRIATSIRARVVVEVAGGTLKNHDVRVGDRLYLSDQRSASQPSAI
jgi:uncharacterized protein